MPVLSGIKQNLPEISACCQWLVLHPARHIIGHFKFHAIICTGTNNTEQKATKAHRKHLS